MNKKLLNSVLIVLLIFIWGSVIYKYFGNKKITNQNLNTIEMSYIQEVDFSFSKDTFELKLNDKDPFGISTRRSSTNIVNNSNKVSSKKKVEVKDMIWPTISYYGFVRGEKNATRLVLIKINNKLFRKREGEKIDDVTILKSFSDSIQVKFNKQSKTIKKINEKI